LQGVELQIDLEAASLGGRFPRAQSSRLAVFGGRGMSFNIWRGTLGSLAMFTAIRNARATQRATYC